jgi:quercetin dioxygenase-like cupin family protein
MKKFFLLISIASLAFSCNEHSKNSEAKAWTHPEDSAANKKTELNIDALTASPENFKLLLENDYVRVLEYNLNPGERDQWHTHPPKSSYVVSGGKLKVHLENGDSLVVDEISGTSQWMDYLGKHYVENIGDTQIKYVLTEIKSLEN